MLNRAPQAPVTVHRQGPCIAIVAEPGWTEADWDAHVPSDVQLLNPGEWDYRVIDGREVWIVNTKDLA